MVVVSAGHFELFKSECQKWIDKLELNNWEIYWVLWDFDNAISQITTNLPGYSATISLCKKWDDSIAPLNNDEIKKAAKHEVIHLLTARLFCSGQSRYISIDELSEAEHELVRKLEKFISLDG